MPEGGLRIGIKSTGGKEGTIFFEVRDMKI